MRGIIKDKRHCILLLCIKNYQLIELLKSRNADESIMDNNGKTADDYIIIYEDTDLSDAMRENGECRIN